MAYDFTKFKKEAADVEEWLRREYSGLNAGRATPALLDTVQVEAYGARTPIAHVASVAIEDPRTLLVAPYDKSQIKDVEKAIMAANLGLSVSATDSGVRVSVPQLTTERRTALVKVLKERLEEARVSLRAEREKVWDDIQEQERDGKMAEDDKFKGKEELQRQVDEANKKLEEIFEKKEKEVLG